MMIGNASDYVTGVTYAGTSMTKIAHVAGHDSLGDAYLWYLAAPTSGANNVVATLSTGSHVLLTASSYTGAAQIGNPEAFATNTVSNSTTITGSVTTLSNNAWTIMFGGNFNLGNTAGTNSTLRSIDNYPGGGLTAIYDSGGPIASPSSESMMI
jgi:hypothetical protein